MEPRPTFRIRLSLADKIIEAMGWLALILLWVWPFVNYSNLPGTIPVHFNGVGQVDNYGNKATIFILPAIGTILFTVLTVLNKFPQIFNYPAEITAANASRQYTNATRMIRVLKFAIVLAFSLIVFKTFQTATGNTEGLGVWAFPIIPGLILIPLIFFVVRAFRIK